MPLGWIFFHILIMAPLFASQCIISPHFEVAYSRDLCFRGASPWKQPGPMEWPQTARHSTVFSSPTQLLSYCYCYCNCIGKGNGTPLQHSCLENPIDRGAWWAAGHGVAKSRTRLSNFTLLFTFMHWRRKWQPTPVFLPGESQGPGSLVGCRLWGRTESDITEAT